MNRLQKYITSGLLLCSGLLVFGGGGMDVLIGGDIVQTVVADGELQTDSNTDQQKMLQALVNGLNLVLSLLTIIVSPIIILASWLMSPDWTSGDLFNIRGTLHDMWIMVSNITYFIYAVLLIFIALATIFGSEHYGYKALLPKLAIGILMVPLTWWFVQFIISLATIVTAQVIEIPAQTAMKQNTNNPFWTAASIPKETKIGTAPVMSGGKLETCSKTPANCISPQDFIRDGGGMYGSLLIYSFGVFQFQEIENIKTNTDVFKSIVQIVNQGIVGAIAFLIFGLLVLALVSVLMIRAIKLWVYAIFSPFFTLAFTLGDGWKKFDENETFSITEFIGLAFAPALIGLTLSFGLVIVSALLHSPGSSPSGGSATCTEPGKPECTMVMFGNPKNTITSYSSGAEAGSGKLITQVKIGEVGWTFEGDVGSGKLSSIKGGLNGMAGIIGTIIIDVIALVFIWVAFIAGSKMNKVVKAAVEPFEEMGKKVSSMGKNLPTYAPIPFTGGQSIASLNKATHQIGTHFETTKDQKAQMQARKLAGWAFTGEMKPEHDAKLTKALQRLNLNTAAINSGNIGRYNDYTDTWKDAIRETTESSPANLKKQEEFLKNIYNKSDKKDVTINEILKKQFNIDPTITLGQNTIKIMKGETLDITSQQQIYKAIQSAQKSGPQLKSAITKSISKDEAVTKLKAHDNNSFTTDELRSKLEEIYDNEVVPGTTQKISDYIMDKLTATGSGFTFK